MTEHVYVKIITMRNRCRKYNFLNPFRGSIGTLLRFKKIKTYYILFKCISKTFKAIIIRVNVEKKLVNTIGCHVRLPFFFLCDLLYFKENRCAGRDFDSFIDCSIRFVINTTSLRVSDKFL